MHSLVIPNTFTPARILAILTPQKRRLSFMLGENWLYIALDFTTVPAQEILTKSLPYLGMSQKTSPFKLGYVLYYPYTLSYKPRAYRIRAVLAIHQPSQVGHLYAETSAQLDHWAHVILATPPSQSELAEWSIELIPQTADSDYLATVERIQADIREGKYYQLNFLRYFTAKLRCNSRGMLTKYLRHGGHYASLLDEPDITILSLSPERFVAMEDGVLSTFPIKGTRRKKFNTENRCWGDKDNAELNLIVDLMRNDFNRIALGPGVTNVRAANALTNAVGIEHQYAHITTTPRSNLLLNDLIQAVCPGGSITGAPKRTVMEHIEKYEATERGFFMGNTFYLDPESGYLDSNILIRTLVKSPNSTTYAAGGGIGIKSTPMDELNEIHLKCLSFLEPI